MPFVKRESSEKPTQQKILAISGSPVKKGNVDAFVHAIMASASRRGLETETVNLSGRRIENCTHCNFCLSKQTEGRYCAFDDDAQAIFERMEGADIIVLASPVYFMRTSGMMATFIDRLRVFIFGNIAGSRLRNKIGLSAGVSWNRHGGMETTHLSHLYAFFTLDMIPAATHTGISPLGASAVASRHGEGAFDPDLRLGVDEDRAGAASAEAHLSRALELAALMRGTN